MRDDKFGRKNYREMQAAHSEFLKAGAKAIRKIKKAFPLGTRVRVEVTLGRYSFGTVEAHPWDNTRPDYLVIKNSRTGRNHSHHYAQLDFQKDLK